MNYAANTRAEARSIAADFRRIFPGFLVTISAPLFDGDLYRITCNP